MVNLPAEGRRPLAAILMIAAVLAAGGAAAGEDRTPLATAGTPPSFYRSVSGRFRVMGGSPEANHRVGLWIEDSARKVEQAVGIPMPFRKRRVDVRLGSTVEGDRAKLLQGVFNDVFMQELRLPSSGDADLRKATEPLCRLFLNGYVAALYLETLADYGKTHPATNALPSVPGWLSIGLARNLDPALRAWTSDEAVRRWQEGGLPPPRLVVEANPKEPTDRVAAGMFVTWLLYLPDRSSCLLDLFERISLRKKVTVDWLYPHVGRIRTPEALSEAWDAWMLQQKRIVYSPGTLTPSVFRQIESELAFHPGVAGVPLVGDPAGRISFREAIRRHGESWVPGAARSKAMGLHVMSTGRGFAIGEVIGKYERFLDLLSRPRTSAGTLTLRLDEAEKALAEVRVVMDRLAGD